MLQAAAQVISGLGFGPVTTGALSDALSGAALTVSLLAFGWTVVWSIWQHRRMTRPSLLVRAQRAVPALPDGTTPPSVSVRVVNRGPVPVTLTGVTFAVEGQTEHLFPAPGAWVVQIPGPLAVRLEIGDRWESLLLARPLLDSIERAFGQQESWKLAAVAADAAGDESRSDDVGLRADWAGTPP